MEHPYRIGLRTIKTGLAIMISIFICRLLKSEYTFYAVIATIISMDQSVVGSLKAGKNRLLGTILGTCLGLVVVFIQPDSAILTGLAVMVLIYTCNLMKWNGSIVISGTVLTIIMLNLNGRNPFVYSFSRFLDTFIGIGVAVLVNSFVAPQNYEKKVIQINVKLHALFDQFMESETYDVREIELCYEQFKRAMHIYDSEIRLHHKYTQEIELIKKHALLYPKIITHLRALELTQIEENKNEIKTYHENYANAYITNTERYEIK